MAKPVEQPDAMQTLGTILGEGHNRDAIHVAVFPGKAATVLQPGAHVGFVVALNGDMGPCSRTVGIVDPFLQHPVLEGQRFWVFVYPRTITSLRHVWTHPEFDDEAVVNSVDRSTEMQESLAWLESYASQLGDGTDATSLLLHATEYLEDGSYWSREDFESLHLADAFWDHYEVVTGTKVRFGNRGSFFSCGC